MTSYQLHPGRPGARALMQLKVVEECMMALLVSTKIVVRRGGSRQCLRDWRIVALDDNGADVTFLQLFTGLVSHTFDRNDPLLLSEDLAGKPLNCQLAPAKSGDFQDVPLHVKVADAVPIFGIYVRFTIDSSEEQQVQTAMLDCHFFLILNL